MLLRATELFDYSIAAIDGEIGKVDNIFFDDQTWTVQYLVITTGPWLNRKSVLLSPRSVGQPNPSELVLPAQLTKDQIENSPDVDTKLPVSRQQEHAMNQYYGWPHYPSVSPATPETAVELSSSPHLRSFKDVLGYRIETSDGELGHLDEMVVEVETWRIRYAVIDTLNWLPGRRALIAPDWIEHISWPDEAITIRISKELVATSPEYNPDASIDRVFESELYRHYGRRGYWN